MTKSRYGMTAGEIALAALLSAGMVAFPSQLLSQEDEEELLEEAMQMKEEMEALKKEIVEEVIRTPRVPPAPSVYVQEQEARREARPKFGLYLDDLDFEDVYEMHYPQNYGVLIDGVVRGGNADLAGLREGDIIMEFGGERARYEDHLIRMRNARSIGDTVEIKYFRDEKVKTTNIVFRPPVWEEDEEYGEVPDKVGEKLSPGYGGGAFEPYLINFDFREISDFLEVNGFDPISGDFVVAWGGGGMGNVGGGWFIGGAGGGFSKREQIPILDDQGNATGGLKAYKLESGFGGVTLVKKVPLFSDRFVLDVGMLLGAGGTKLSVNQTDGDIDWADNVTGKNTYAVRFEKSYFVYRPSAGLLVRIKNWVGIHGSVGYLGAYAGDDKWTAKPFDFTVGDDINDSSPDVPSGISYSIGFWFGY